MKRAYAREGVKPVMTIKQLETHLHKWTFKLKQIHDGRKVHPNELHNVKVMIRQIHSLIAWKENPLSQC